MFDELFLITTLRRKSYRICAAAMKLHLTCLLALTLTSAVSAQSTAFTYQGHLMDAGASANGNYDIQFTLKNALTAGVTVGTAQAVSPATAVNGIFSVTLDFGSAPFDGTDRWVELGVRPFGSVVAYTVLAPRQRLAATPYALRSLSANNAANLTGTITAGNIANGTITGAMIASNTSISANSVTALSFSGNGAALTNLPTSALIGTIPASQIAAPPLGMVLIPAGAFTMGNSIAADTDITNATPVSTTVSTFYMDVNEVTLSQWQSVYYWATSNGYTFTNAGTGKGPNHPVHTVDWYDVVKWCNARSQHTGKTPVYYTNDAQTTIYKTGNVNVTNAQVKWNANGYRLPTEAEWEKAARGGRSGQRFPWGNTVTQNLANYYGDTATLVYDLGPNDYNDIGSIGGTTPATSPVGSFTLNGYGLNDMTGNVWEWCWDWYGTYTGGTDPRGVPSGSIRVYRGGGWGNVAGYMRCADRNGNPPSFASGSSVGFRAVLAPGQP